jgi:uncharacterized membrane protein
MRSTIKAAAIAAGAGIIIQQISRSRVRAPADGTGAEPRNRWRAVTVNKAPGEVTPDGNLPKPLADLGDSVEVRITPAADSKGTELAARLREPEPSGAGALPARLSGRDPRQAVRSALRESKQLLEVGEILRVDPQPAGDRTPTPMGKLLETATRRAGGEGVV